MMAGRYGRCIIWIMIVLWQTSATLSQSDSSPTAEVTPSVDISLIPTEDMSSASDSDVYSLSPTPIDQNSVSPTPSDQNNMSPTPSDQNNVSPTPSDQNNVSPTPSDQNNVLPTSSDQNNVLLTSSDQNDVSPTPSDQIKMSSTLSDQSNISPISTEQNSIAPSLTGPGESTPSSTGRDEEIITATSEEYSSTFQIVSEKTSSYPIQPTESGMLTSFTEDSTTQGFQVESSFSSTVSLADSPSSVPPGEDSPSSVPPGEDSPSSVPPGEDSATPTIDEESSPAVSTQLNNIDTTSAELGITATSTWLSSTAPPFTESTVVTEEGTSPDTTTTPSTTTTQAPAATTKIPDSTVTAKPDLDRSVFRLKFEIHVDSEFDVALGNTSSDLYKEYVKKSKEEALKDVSDMKAASNHKRKEVVYKLTAIYVKLPDFLSVDILGFRNGSIGIDHNVTLLATVDAAELNSTLGEIADKMKNGTLLGANVSKPIDTKQIAEALKTVADKCNAEGICGSGKAFECKNYGTDKPVCVSKCPPDHCAHGDCRVDSDENFYCRCHIDGKFAYTGEKCDVVSEKLALNEASIIGIGAGAGGGVVLLLLIALSVTCYLRRKDNNNAKHSEAEDYSLIPLPRHHEDKVRLSKLNGHEAKEFFSPPTGESNYGYDSRYHRRTGQGRDQQGRDGTDYAPRGPSNYKQGEDVRGGNLRSDYFADEDAGDWEDPEFPPSSKKDGLRNKRKTGIGRSFYDPADELEFDRTDDSRRSSHVKSGDEDIGRLTSDLPPDLPMKFKPPLLTGQVREGESVLMHVDTEQTLYGDGQT